MNRPYTAYSPYSLTPTERIDGFADDHTGEFDYEGLHEYRDYETYRDFDNPPGSAPLTDTEYDEARIDRRWMWIAGIAGAILFVAVGTTGVILGGGDSGSVSATDTAAPPVSSEAPAATTSAPAAAVAPAPAMPSLPPETVTTVSPTAEAPPAPVPTQQAAPPPPAPAPRTVTYQVTGNRQLIDLVTVIYTDAQGALQTDVNVALPWTKTVVLDPGVELSSVTATSVAGQLNCSITDAAGAVLVAQNANTMITTCTK
ncbi:MmpS family transport accessory protein [Mycolicibacterium sp. XJ1819]